LQIAFMLAFSISVNLEGVVVFDGAKDCAQHLDELRGGRIGEPR
jgi:hypothetical protein